MTDKTMSAINNIVPDKSKRVIINEYKNNDKHILLHTNYDNWLDQLKTYIRTGKKIAITTSSFTEGEKIVETLFKTNETLVGKWKFYHQDCDDKMMEDFHNINDVWSKLDYVIYTPKVTVGADFNVEHFDYIFSFAHPLSCPVETTFQMIGRIRKPKTPYVHLYVKEIKQTNLSLSYGDIKDELLKKKDTLNELYKIMDTSLMFDGTIVRETITNSWINDVYIYHQQEVNLSKTDYVRRFFDIANEKGWDIYLAEKSVSIFDNTNEDFYDTKAPKSSQQLYESINLEKFDYEKAEKNKKYRTATSVQKLGLNNGRWFVIHNSPGINLGNQILSLDTTGNIKYYPGMTVGETYYISAVIGRKLSDGTLDLSDPCLSISQGTPVKILPTPETPFKIAVSDTLVCPGSSIVLQTNKQDNGFIYNWQTPKGFVNTLTPSLTIPKFESKDIGNYYLRINT